MVGRLVVRFAFMERSRGSSVACKALDAIQVSLPTEPFADSRGERGAPLLLVAACRAQGHAIEGPFLDALAERLALPARRVVEIAAFCDEVMADQGAITLCRGVTCSMYGAERLHGHLKEALRALGGEREYREVFCLSQCEYGPSVMHGNRIWVTRARRVVEDGRVWRDEDSGPVSLNDTSSPVAD